MSDFGAKTRISLLVVLIVMIASTGDQAQYVEAASSRKSNLESKVINDFSTDNILWVSLDTEIYIEEFLSKDSFFNESNVDQIVEKSICHTTLYRGSLTIYDGIYCSNDIQIADGATIRIVFKDVKLTKDQIKIGKLMTISNLTFSPFRLKGGKVHFEEEKIEWSLGIKNGVVVGGVGICLCDRICDLGKESLVSRLMISFSLRNIKFEKKTAKSGKCLGLTEKFKDYLLTSKYINRELHGNVMKLLKDVGTKKRVKIESIQRE